MGEKVLLAIKQKDTGQKQALSNAALYQFTNK